MQGVPLPGRELRDVNHHLLTRGTPHRQKARHLVFHMATLETQDWRAPRQFPSLFYVAIKLLASTCCCHLLEDRERQSPAVMVLSDFLLNISGRTPYYA